MCQLSQLCWNFLSARRTKVLLKVPFYFISAGGGWRSHWEHLSLYWLYTKILYLMQYCTHSVLNIEKKALLLLLKLISRKISWKWFHDKMRKLSTDFTPREENFKLEKLYESFFFCIFQWWSYWTSPC